MVFWWGLTPRLTGAGARSAEGTDMGHENAEGMAHVGVRVEPTVRLGSEVEGQREHGDLPFNLDAQRCIALPSLMPTAHL